MSVQPNYETGYPYYSADDNTPIYVQCAGGRVFIFHEFMFLNFNKSRLKLFASYDMNLNFHVHVIFQKNTPFQSTA